jgi:hypothetical protein
MKFWDSKSVKRTIVLWKKHQKIIQNFILNRLVQLELSLETFILNRLVQLELSLETFIGFLVSGALTAH